MTTGPIDSPFIDFFNDNSFLPGSLLRKAKCEPDITTLDRHSSRSSRSRKCSPPRRQNSLRSMRTQFNAGAFENERLDQTPKSRRSHHRRRSSKEGGNEPPESLRSLLEPQRSRRKTRMGGDSVSTGTHSKGSRESKSSDERSRELSRRRSSRKMNPNTENTESNTRIHQLEKIKSSRRLKAGSEDGLVRRPPERQKSHKSKKSAKSSKTVDEQHTTPELRRHSSGTKSIYPEPVEENKCHTKLKKQKSGKKLKSVSDANSKVSPQTDAFLKQLEEECLRISGHQPIKREHVENLLAQAGVYPEESESRPQLNRQERSRQLKVGPPEEEADPGEKTGHRAVTQMRRQFSRSRSRSRERNLTASAEFPPTNKLLSRTYKKGETSSEEDDTPSNPLRQAVGRRGSVSGMRRSRSADGLRTSSKKKEVSRRLPTRTRSSNFSLQMLRDAQAPDPGDLCNRSTFSSLSHKKRLSQENEQKHVRRSSLGGQFEKSALGGVLNSNFRSESNNLIPIPQSSHSDNPDSLFDESLHFSDAEDLSAEPKVKTRRRLSAAEVSKLKRPDAFGLVESSVTRIPIELQSIFLASQSGEEVIEPPGECDANQVFTRQRWLAKWRLAGKQKSRKEKLTDDPVNGHKDAHKFSMVAGGNMRKGGKIKDHSKLNDQSKPPVRVEADPDSSEWEGYGDGEDELFRRRPEDGIPASCINTLGLLKE